MINPTKLDAVAAKLDALGARFDALGARADDDQPRDEDGRWTSKSHRDGGKTHTYQHPTSKTPWGKARTGKVHELPGGEVIGESTTGLARHHPSVAEAKKWVEG